MKRQFVFRNLDGRTTKSYSLKKLAERLGISIHSALSISTGRRIILGWYSNRTPAAKKKARRKIFNQELINLETKEVVRMGLNRKKTIEEVLKTKSSGPRHMLQGIYKYQNAPRGWMDKKTYDLIHSNPSL